MSENHHAKRSRRAAIALGCLTTGALFGAAIAAQPAAIAAPIAHQFQVAYTPGAIDLTATPSTAIVVSGD